MGVLLLDHGLDRMSGRHRGVSFLLPRSGIQQPIPLQLGPEESAVVQVDPAPVRRRGRVEECRLVPCEGLFEDRRVFIHDKRTGGEGSIGVFGEREGEVGGCRDGKEEDHELRNREQRLTFHSVHLRPTTAKFECTHNQTAINARSELEPHCRDKGEHEQG